MGWVFYIKQEDRYMKVLVVGGGGREHVIGWKLSLSPMVDKIYSAPGNAGMSEITDCIPLAADDISGLLSFAREKKIDLTVVGPEAPLVSGIADRFKEEGLNIFGFRKGGASLEGSKVKAKKFMKRHKVPTGDFSVFENPVRAMDEIKSRTPPYVIKADGLAAGKGVIVCNSIEEAGSAIDSLMKKKLFGSAGDRVVLDEFLAGEEISVLAVMDGKDYKLFVPSQDHKRAYDNDEGPNTGGMGAYAPVPMVEEELMKKIREEIIDATITGMMEEGIAGAGVLYFGLICTEEGPKVLEYNVRFGDPETQVILPLFQGDLAELMMAANSGELAKVSFTNSDEAAACVVMASGGYPLSYEKGYVIHGLDAVSDRGCKVFHAGTKRKDEEILTDGGRVLGVTAVARSLKDALDRAYTCVEEIEFKDSFFRKDIGRRGITLNKEWI
jgi:phosphoribosylamine--glycine ligase